MTDMTRLETLFNEIGWYQRAIEERGLPLASGGPEIIARCREVAALLPPGNEHIWDDLRLWIGQSWASAEQSGGITASEPWRVFLVEVGNLLEESQRRAAANAVQQSNERPAMNGERFEELLHAVLRQIDLPGWDVIFPGHATWFVNGTVGAVFAYGGVAARTGVGLLSGLSVSDELLHDISDLNRTIGGGSFWLSEGEKGNWQLVWGTKMMLEYFETDKFAVDYIVQVVRAVPLLVENHQERFREKFGGQPWWGNDVNLGAQALVLLANTA
jgi:hypothetical protein